ncbi:TonB-dependent receptor [Allosphingosinicella flava]|uniref:TonB-dependent receptor n=1 Tax=Allosphingosinicella flava TaxID=2771430 RepID=A0A7T2LN18_9SPHN|nr:TonB-dependent receptor [Sphingosinicella flava]QPQ56154.1 TonB-dependent receptor [Sphingosinicella flava]
MTLNKDFRRFVLMGGAAMVALTAGAPAYAQNTQSRDAAQPVEGEQEIVVTGFRASLESAVAEKKDRDQIVESISAEDIGKLPDASIAESIARLPGLTSQRLSGRATSISIRGFAPDFSTTLLNGREQTSTGDNRAVEFDQYPSEVVNQVLVYKTPMASLVGQGLSGTVDLRTIRPIDFGRQVISVGARGSYADIGKLNAGSNDMGYRVYGTYVDQFANDTLGVALSASYTDEPYHIEEFEAWGYAEGPGGNRVIGGVKPYVTSTQLKRLGLQGTVQWRPAPEFTTTVDGFYSDFKDEQIKRGIELPLFWSGASLTPGDVVDGQIVSGTFAGVEGVVRNDLFVRNAQLYSFGWNGKYEGDDGWNVMADIGFSKTDRNELNFETNAGTGRGGGVGATDTIAFRSGRNGTTFRPTLNYGDYNLIQLTSPLGWGGDQTAVDGTRIRGGQDGYYNNRIIEDELWQYRFEIEKELEGAVRSVQFGFNYTDREKSLVPDEYFVGLVANTDGRTSVVVPEQYRRGTTNLRYLGLGPVISYDPRELLDAGIYQLVRNPYGDVVVKSYDISEEIMTWYTQGNIDTMLGASQLTGNFGVQAVLTDQRSRGAQASQIGNNPNGSPNIVGIPRNEGAEYIDILPSLNLSLRLPSDFVIRVGAAREIIRPRLDDLKASLSYGFNYDVQPNVATVRGSSGNPELRPWRANAVDLTFEKYFGLKGYIALQLFWKDLKSYIYNDNVDFDFTGYPVGNPGTFDPDGPAGPLPPRPIPIDYTGDVNVPINGKGGKLYGAEFAATLPLDTFTSALDGFGLTGGVSYTKTSISPRPNQDPEELPGYSKWVANGTAYFEKWGFSARASVRHRSSFAGEISGFGGSRERRRALAETILDAQIGYDFQPGSTLEGLSLFLQAQNLTDEPFVTIDPGERLQVRNHQSYGRRFLAGFGYKF